MRNAFGTAALVVGLGSSLGAMTCWARSRHSRQAAARARTLTWATLLFAAGACAVLVNALTVHDFSVRYVAENGNRAVPVYYTIISLWAALEGSLLLWVLVLAGYTALAMRAEYPQAAALQPWAMAVLSSVAAFFFGLALFAGNAFETVSPVPTDGPGPNPLLQDHPLMGVHPPVLYLGYVGMTVPFAYAVAALISGQTGREWLLAARRWALAAWTFLTIGIVLGAWWSYEVLGWGGYWAWDPVENASILPWFTSTALLHSMMVQERRVALRAWNLALASSSFLLVLVGTFLTRSGVIASVHSFTQSAVGPLLLGYLLAVGLGVGVLFVWRADRLGPTTQSVAPLSRESMFLSNNVVLVALAFTVLLGTVFPLVIEAVNRQRVTVGPVYFNRMTVPLALALVLLMGVGPLVHWGAMDPSTLARRLRVPAALGLVTVAGLGLSGLHGVGALLTFGLAVFTAATICVRFTTGARAARAATGAGRMRSVAIAVARRRRLYGGLIVHAGVVLAAVAIAGSSAYGVREERTVAVGDAFTVAGYTATLTGIAEERTPRLMAVRATVRLAAGRRDLGVRAPALRFYPGTSDTIGTPSVRTSLAEDVYLTVTSVNEARTEATIGLAVNPLMIWLWISGAVMLIGALTVGWPNRRRPSPASRQPQALVMAQGGMHDGD